MRRRHWLAGLIIIALLLPLLHVHDEAPSSHHSCRICSVSTTIAATAIPGTPSAPLYTPIAAVSALLQPILAGVFYAFWGRGPPQS
jgi:hypothetical protein